MNNFYPEYIRQITKARKSLIPERKLHLPEEQALFRNFGKVNWEKMKRSRSSFATQIRQLAGYATKLETGVLEENTEAASGLCYLLFGKGTKINRMRALLKSF